MIREILLQHGGRSKWERAHDLVMINMKTEWNNANGSKTLTLHIAAYQIHLVDLTRCCKHTGRSPPTVREQVLWMVCSIITTNPLLIAHMAQINGNPISLVMNFEAAATHLMLADLVEKSKVKRKRLRNNLSISSALTGRGESGVDFRWYNRDEFKGFNQDQKDELSA